MAALASGFNYSTTSQSGIAFDTCWTIDLIDFPEYPLPPFLFGTQVQGLDNSLWCFARPITAYPIGTVGYFDPSWNFIAVTTANGDNIVGSSVGVMSQVASTVINPTNLLYDGIWVQISGATPAIRVCKLTSAFSTLYTTNQFPGVLTSNYGGQPINSIVTINPSISVSTQPGTISP